MQVYFDRNQTVGGLENIGAIEAPSMAARRESLGSFIDPQHTDGLKVSAFKFAVKHLEAKPGLDYMTDAVDVDSAATYLYMSGKVLKSDICLAAIEAIDQHDNLSGLPAWEKGKGDFSPVWVRDPVMNYLTRSLKDGYDELEKYIRGEEVNFKPSAGEFKVHQLKKLVALIGDGPGAAEVGYFYSPIVVNYQEKLKRVSICSWPGHLSLGKLAKHLGKGWGGQEFIIGSPRGVEIDENQFKEVLFQTKCWVRKEILHQKPSPFGEGFVSEDKDEVMFRRLLLAENDDLELTGGELEKFESNFNIRFVTRTHLNPGVLGISRYKVTYNKADLRSAKRRFLEDVLGFDVLGF